MMEKDMTPGKNDIINGFLTWAEIDPEVILRNLKKDGSHVMGYLCSYTPVEMLSVKGLIPYRMKSPSCIGTDFADTYMGRVTCSYTRSILESAGEGKYSLVDGFVFTTGCDHMRRLHDNLVYLRSPSFVSMLDLPHKDTPEAVQWYGKELKRLGSEIEASFHADMSESALSQVIKDQNSLRKLILSLDETRAREHLAFSGTDVTSIIAGLAAVPFDRGYADIEALLQLVETAPPYKGYRARLILVSNQLDNPGFIRVIERTGGMVVGEMACTGASSYEGLVDENAPPYDALASRYLCRVPCPRMMERFDALVSEVKRLYFSRKADGIILLCMKFCDTWGLEGSLLVRTLREEGIPVLRLEREYVLSGEGQMATRVQAFLESMGK